MKKYSVTFSYDIEAETENEAIDEFLKRMYDQDDISPPDSDDFIAKEKKS